MARNEKKYNLKVDQTFTLLLSIYLYIKAILKSVPNGIA